MFRVVFELFGLYLDRRRPHVFWIEEVNTFGAEGPNGEEAPVQILMRICVAKGYACRAFLANHGDWVHNPRNRCYMIGIGPEVVGCIQECLRHRRMRAPTAIADVVDLHSLGEVSRRQRDKTCFCCFCIVVMVLFFLSDPVGRPKPPGPGGARSQPFCM